MVLLSPLPWLLSLPTIVMICIPWARTMCPRYLESIPCCISSNPHDALKGTQHFFFFNSEVADASILFIFINRVSPGWQSPNKAVWIPTLSDFRSVVPAPPVTLPEFLRPSSCCHLDEMSPPRRLQSPSSRALPVPALGAATFTLLIKVRPYHKRTREEIVHIFQRSISEVIKEMQMKTSSIFHL